jgi:glycine/D-amino acid oxidase-like deaminating enzyme
MKHLYHPSALDPKRAVASWWSETLQPPAYPPLQADVDTEVAIIGGGFTGLSAAYHLAREHGIHAVVLERAYPGWGGSGRNGGFCCMGSSKMPWQTMVTRFGIDEATRFWKSQRASIELVGDIVSTSNIDVDRTGSGEVTLAHRPTSMGELRQEAEFLARTFGAGTTLLAKQDLIDRGMDSPHFHGGMHSADGFGLNPWKYVHGLAAAAAATGAAIHAGTEVTGWQRDGDRHVLSTPAGRVRARKVLIATAAYTPEDLHNDYGGRVLPALSSIVVTRPLSDDELARQGWRDTTPAFDNRHLLSYFRLLPDRRFLFGGRGGLSAEPQALAKQIDRVEQQFRRYFPNWQDVAVTHRWSGLVCLAADLMPHVGEWDEQPGCYFAMCYHGNGVAMGTWSGRAVADVIAGHRGGVGDQRAAFIRQPPPRFPLAALRPLYLRGAYLKYGICDAMQ